ncbi:hypothetical protein Clacol_009170 [Clathrus columnatus]|uniref:GST N-terminal domain-containing protein n=1 Tax=Clathrus columnatus TaxID=1419009 RepID=A0AAV5AQ05_9AGAM|nr:hypothetical protein Clacol_009170 [Clathrus columnatus]
MVLTAVSHDSRRDDAELPESRLGKIQFTYNENMSLVMGSKQITLYITQTCPWAARARIALREVNVPFTEHDIDLRNKPQWYLSDVNPAGLVPAIAYGGPNVPPDQPSSESIKLRESLLIVEWVADEFPKSNLLPESPLNRYRARLIIDVVATKLVTALNALVFRDGTSEDLIKSIELVQKELVPSAKYALSDQFTIADAASAPFISRVILFLKNDLGVSTEPGQSKGLYDLITQDAKFSRFWSYAQAILERPSVKDVINEVRVPIRYDSLWLIIKSRNC